MILSKIITLIEDRKIRLNLSTQEMNDINYFKSFLGPQNVIIEYDGSVRIMHYVGFISKGKTRVQILPKIFESSQPLSNEEVLNSTKVLYKLLKESMFNRVLELKDPSDLNMDSFDFLELFIKLFAIKIIKLYSIKTNREYLTLEENTSFIKGKINFSQSIKKNIARKDLHVVHYQSFEVDNLLNNIIKSVAIQLLLSTKNPENKKLLKLALTYLDDASEIKLTYQTIESVKFTRLNKEFEPVYNMAKMFFKNQQPSSFEGEETIFSFLVPLNELFEEYMFKLLQTMPNFTCKHGEMKQFAYSDKKNHLNIKPDYVLYENSKAIFVADAKYKNPFDYDGKDIKVNRNDIYQIFTYMKLYGVRTGILIYPAFKNIGEAENENITLEDSISRNTLKVILIDIVNKDFDELSVCLSRELVYSSFQ